MPDEQQQFEDALDKNPDDWDLRQVYADWLEDKGYESLCVAQRWMSTHRVHPIRQQNVFPTFIWDLTNTDLCTRPDSRNVWLWSRQAAERWLANRLG